VNVSRFRSRGCRPECGSRSVAHRGRHLLPHGIRGGPDRQRRPGNGQHPRLRCRRQDGHGPRRCVADPGPPALDLGPGGRVPSAGARLVRRCGAAARSASRAVGAPSWSPRAVHPGRAHVAAYPAWCGVDPNYESPAKLASDCVNWGHATPDRKGGSDVRWPSPDTGCTCATFGLAEELGAERGSVVDILLPDWAARRIPVVAGSAALLALVLNLRARLGSASLESTGEPR
jgi:hypothetical protein